MMVLPSANGLRVMAISHGDHEAGKGVKSYIHKIQSRVDKRNPIGG